MGSLVTQTGLITPGSIPSLCLMIAVAGRYRMGSEMLLHAPPVQRHSLHVISSSLFLSPGARALTSDVLLIGCYGNIFPYTPFLFPPSLSALVGPQWYSQHLAAQWLQGGELRESDSASANLGSVHLCFFSFLIAFFFESFFPPPLRHLYL